MAGQSKCSRTNQRPDETQEERLDRNYNELLQEMRVLQAGMQILFAFLLSLAFQSRFTSVTDFQRGVYLTTLLSAALATACIIGPVPFHRVVFRRGMKDDLMRAATRYVSTGLVLFFVSIIGALLLVLDFLLSRTAAVVISAVLAVIFVALWLVLPMLARATEDETWQARP